MNKRLISIAVILLLMFSILPAAYADVTYPAPGDIEAGSTLDHLLAVVSTGNTVTAAENTMPSGIVLETEEQTDGLYVYLRGTPTTVGSYNCVITVNNSSKLVCPINVIPAKPVVTAGSGVTCYPNSAAQLSVSATVADSGSLSYQWYSNPNNNTSGGEAIQDATGNSYQADTSHIGTTYYYCIVTNTNKGKTSSSVSATIAVKVEDISVNSISVEALPTKTKYMLGDTLDTAGLLVHVKFNNGSSNVLSEGFGIYPTKLNNLGTQTIEISYQGKNCSFTVNVSKADEVIDGIGVLTKPTKTEYTLGESLNPAGLSIRVYTNNGHRDVTTDLICSPTELTKAGTQTITVTYGERTCTFSVKVKAEEKPVGLSVSTMPSKLEYTVGDSLDTAGLVLKLVTSANKNEEIKTGFTCSPTVLAKAGRQTITVSYKELTCSFTVTVVEKDAAVSASPDVSPVVSPSATPHITEHQSHETNISRVLVVIIIIAAVLALAGLGTYVFIMNRGGIEKFKDRAEEIIRRIRRR